MDDFQHRLLVALERLAGRGDEPTAPDHLATLVGQLGELTEVLEEIRDRLPPAGP